MTVTSLTYADSRAAAMLAEGLKRYTAQHPGGLRAVAADLEIKQATVLSHMATGRIGIPLDRATELASKLEINVADFCLAVLEQRAPTVYKALDDELVLLESSRLPTGLREVLAGVTSDRITDEHTQIIGEILATKRPAEKWMRPLEDDIVRVVRDIFPGGLSFTQSRELIDWIKAFDG
jgi:hypothetical protein